MVVKEERNYELERIELQLKILETEREIINKMPTDMLLKISGYV